MVERKGMDNRRQ